MANIKFSGISGGEHVKLTITQNENGMHYRINDMSIPNVMKVRLIALDSIPRVEITVVVNEIDGDFKVGLSE